MSAERLWQAVELDHRGKVAAAAAADARYRLPDQLVKVRVTAAFWLAGREALPGEVVDVPRWLLSDLAGRGLAQQCDTPSATP